LRLAIGDDRHRAYTEKLGDHWQITLLQKVVSVWVLVAIVRAGVLSVEARFHPGFVDGAGNRATELTRPGAFG